MNSFKLPQLALQTIYKAALLINEEYMSANIDIPIEEVTRTFLAGEDLEYSHPFFHQILTEYVRALYAHDKLFSRKLSALQAHREAISLLEQNYQGICYHGYDAAVDDACEPLCAGIKTVIHFLASSLKSNLRQKHLQVVKLKYFDTADRDLQYAMVSILRERLKIYLIPELVTCPASQLVDDISDLLQKCIRLDRI